jgi:hypothetical protein
MEYAHGRVIAWAVAACAALTATVSSAATTWKVCTDSCTLKTLQGAVDVAVSGDQIVVYPGRYVGNVTIAGKSLTITGANQATAQVQIVGTGTGPVFTLGANDRGPYYEVAMSFLTVSGGGHFRGTRQGGGIQVRQGAFLFLSSATVTGNSAVQGGGISVNTPGGPMSELFNACTVSSNTAESGGGLYIAAGSTVSLANCTVSTNSATGDVSRTTAALGGGIYMEAGSVLDTVETVISANTVTGPCRVSGGDHISCAPAIGAGMYVLGQLSMASDDIVQNTATNDYGVAEGGGIYLSVGPQLSIQSSVISNNIVFAGNGPATGGGIFAATSNPSAQWTLNGVYVIQNDAPLPGAGGVQNQGTLVLMNDSMIKDNLYVQCLGGTGCPPN